ncbi:MAG: hypothetical protein V3T83_15015 [Acidobacteriota bacterium]
MNAPPPSPSPWTAYRWPAVIVALALIALGGYALTLWWAGRAAQQALEGIGDIAERFRSQHITATFRSALPELTSTPGGLLELASIRQPETITRSNEKRILWDWVSLGKSVAEIRVPVTYRYHVELRDPWSIEVSGQTCIVRAPPLRPTLPPAIHSQELEQRIDQSWLRFDADEQMSQLLKSITPTLESQASDTRRLEIVRERARRTVAEFVRDWLLKEDHWRQDRFRAVIVVFADEQAEDGAVLGTALTLEQE